MRGGPLGLLPLFLAVAEKRSFTAAARSLGVSPSAVSQAVARLERELGVVLLLRTTRSVNLTDAGTRLVEEAAPAVGAAAAALASLAEGRNEPSGVLKLNVPRLASRLTLRPLLTEYLRRYPNMRVDVDVDDRNIDIVAQGYDAGVRLRESVEKDMLTIRLSAPIRFVVVGTKTYLASRKRLKHPRELVDQACIRWRSPTTGTAYRWQFEHRGRELEVDVDGPITSTDADVIVACALDGLGLAYVAEHEVRAELDSGQLETVLDDYCPEVPGLFLYYPREAQRVPKLAAFVACVRQFSRRDSVAGHARG